MKGLLRIAAIGIAGAGIAGLAGCATSPAAAASHDRIARQTAALPGKPACFFRINFNGSWTALSNDELIVYAPLYSNPYLIKLFSPVPTLSFAQGLGFRAIERTGMICNDASDDLIVPNWHPHNIPIVAVHQLTVDEADQLLRSHGIKSPYHKERKAAASTPPQPQ